MSKVEKRLTDLEKHTNHLDLKEKFLQISRSLDSKVSCNQLDDLYEKLIVEDLTSLEKKLNERFDLGIDKLSAVFRTHIERTIGGNKGKSEEKSKIIERPVS